MSVARDAFESWYAGFAATGDISPVRLGMARDDLRALFGEPDDTGSVSRRRREPAIWVYGGLEFHFGPSDDRLVLIYRDDAGGVVETCIGRR